MINTRAQKIVPTTSALFAYAFNHKGQEIKDKHKASKMTGYARPAREIRTNIMTNENITNEQIIASAFASTKADDYKTFEDLEVAVATNALKLRWMMNETSLPMRLMNACALRGEVKRVEFEDSSKRYKVFFIATNNENGDEEMIRTDRMDGKQYMTDEYIKNLAGHTCIIYKVNEKNEENNKMMGKGYRIAPYIKPID